MDWQLEIQNRLNVGICIGWSYYDADEEFAWREFILYLGLVSLHFKWG